LIVSIDAEKDSNKIQSHFRIKALMKPGIEVIYLNIIKTTYDKLRANIILRWEKSEVISPKVRNKTKVSTLLTPIPHSLGIPNHSNEARRRNKRNTDR
jgi:hypothetical protein